MSTPNRNNGLPAERWAPLVDLEPHFADALLDALREEGVAAYASPAPGLRGPYLDIQLPNTPTDRVWVDAGAADAARGVLDARRAEFRHPDAPTDQPAAVATGPATDQEPGIPAGGGAHGDGSGERSADRAGDGAGDSSTGAAEPDFDAAWRAIVAGYGRTGGEPVSRWSAAEDVDPEPPARESRRILRREDADHGDDDGWGLPAAAAAEPGPEPAPEDSAEAHYVPPPPPPLPRMDLHAKLAWAGVLGGPLFLILFTALDWEPIPASTFFAIAAFIGGFASLVYRMKDDPDRGGDDGAVV